MESEFNDNTINFDESMINNDNNEVVLDKSVDGMSIIEDIENEQATEVITIKKTETITVEKTKTVVKEISFIESKQSNSKINENLNTSIDELEKLSIDDLIKSLNLPQAQANEIVPDFSKVFYQNRYFKFYMAKSTSKNSNGICSIMMINKYRNRYKDFISILFTLSKLNGLNSKAILQIKDIAIIDDEKVYLVFEPILGSFSQKVKEGSLIDNEVKFTTLYYLFDMLPKIHCLEISLANLSLDNLLYNASNEFRYLIPLSKIILILS